MTWKVQAGQDSDVVNYIAAVEAADGQSLESGVKLAYHNFIIGCKTDGIWDAIKASCIMAGARTLAGALVPLKGTAPTNFNFVSSDYDRETGLVGDGSTKYLDSNYLIPVLNVDNCHGAAFLSSPPSAGVNRITMGNSSGDRHGFYSQSTGNGYRFACSTTSVYTVTSTGIINSIGVIGFNRNSASFYTARIAQTDYIASVPTNTSAIGDMFLFSGINGSFKSDARLSFYSIGESLDLALLDSRLTTLMSDIEVAIP